MVTQCYNVGVDWVWEALGDRYGKVVLTLGKRSVVVLVVAEDNIVRRLDEEGNATWRYPGTLDGYDAVAVMYEPAWIPGATWPESSGNPYKDRYRRLAWSKNVYRHPTIKNCWCEIRGMLTEYNVLRLMKGKELK